VVEQLREILAREGIRASSSADQEGIFFAIEGPDEVSLLYNLSEDKNASPIAASFQMARNDLVRCCSVIADLGFAVTLILSPRTLALFVRSEGSLRFVECESDCGFGDESSTFGEQAFAVGRGEAFVQ